MIGVTDFVYKRFIEIAKVPANKCFSAPNGIVPLDLNHADHHYVQKSFGIPEDKIIIIITGRASYYKGIDFVIKCAHELIHNQAKKNLHFLYCGDGPDIEDFKALAKQLNLENEFTFAGKRSDIREMLPSCHIGFHAAEGEVGYSLSILEFMSAGLITIVPDLPSTSLSINHGEDGLCYKSKDLHSAVKAINFALDQLDNNKIQSNAINTVRTKYDIKLTHEKLCAIMDRIITPD